MSYPYCDLPVADTATTLPQALQEYAPQYLSGPGVWRGVWPSLAQTFSSQGDAIPQCGQRATPVKSGPMLP
jgi:hypothetical protein